MVDTMSLRLYLGEHIIYSIVKLRPYIESVDMPVLREYPEKNIVYYEWYNHLKVIQTSAA